MINKIIPTLPTFLTHNLSEENRNAEPVILKMKDTTIHSLKELRENFSPDELLKYYLDGKLVRWLNQHYYEQEAVGISSIKLDDKNCLEHICSALNIPFESKLSAENLEILSAKREKLLQYTNDESILSNPQNVAMNQEELALLLNKDFKKIYLCSEEFSVPISVPNVNYINIANATISNPYTEQQYMRAGIKLQGFHLPTEENPENTILALNAARLNSYDDFSERHSDLATAFHNLFKRGKYTQYYRIPYNSSLSSKFFTSKYECESSAKEEIKKAYNRAVKYVSTGNSLCIAKESAKAYSDYLKNELTSYMELLKKIAQMTSSMNLYNIIENKITKSYTYLLSRFETELNESSNYYQMYDFNYFTNQVDIEEHDYRISDNNALRLFEHLLTNNMQYTINDLYAPISEIEKDLNDHCSTFFNSAFSEYQNFTSEIEDLIETLGRNLPYNKTENESLSDYMTRCCIKLTL